MNTNKFIQKAKEIGLEASEIKISKNTNQSITIFRGKIDQNEMSSVSKVLAKGIYANHLGAVVSENLDNSTIDFLLNQIKINASLSEKEEEPILFEGSSKYSKKNMFSKELEELDTSKVIETMLEIEKKAKELDPRVTDVEVSYSKDSSSLEFANSHGLSLKNKNNNFGLYASCFLKEGDVVKDNGEIIFGDKFEINVDEFTKTLVKKAADKFDSITIDNGTYNVVINNQTVASLINALCSNLSSEQTQKHSSIFEGKEGEKVLSEKLTIEELPLKNNCFRTYFDSEGVATYNKTLINKGVIETLAYNLETAKKANKTTTGNGYGGVKIGIDFTNLTVKNGRLSEEDLFLKIKDGVYVTDLQGLHAGMNAQSGDFSLQAEGYLIKDGKLDKFLNLFTLSGNLFSMFNEIIAVGNNSKLFSSSTECPSIAFKNLKISS